MQMTLYGLQKAQWSLTYQKQSNEERYRDTGIGEDGGSECRHGRRMEHLGAQSRYESRKNPLLTRRKELQILNIQEAGLQQVPKTKGKGKTMSPERV